MKHHARSGQSLIDVLIASGIGAILLVGALSVLAPTLRGTSDAQYAQDGAAYARGLQDDVRSYAASNWNGIAALTEGSAYYIQRTATTTLVTAGTEQATSSLPQGFSRSFAVYTVNRNTSGVVVTSGGYPDLSTRRVVVTYQWPRGAARTLTTYVTRSQSRALVQSDWSGGAGLVTTTTNPGSQFASSTGIDIASSTGSISIDFATAMSSSSGGSGPNISATPAEHYAWNDILGWINFYSSNTVQVTSARMKGYANSAAGEISLDCVTSPAGNVCSGSTYYVANNGGGSLSGYAWNDVYGWISFNCSNHGGCGTSSYSVNINPTTGAFTGYAWNDILGWISFNCSDIAICGTSDYKVVTSWSASAASGVLDSAIIDTGVSGGAQVNGVSWIGSKPAGTEARFQIATASSTSGPWSYVGPDGTVSSYYSPDAGAGSALYTWNHAPARYFRYRATLTSDTSQSTTPRVDDIIVRWSP